MDKTDIARIGERIRYVGVNDRTTARFEALWPLPYGVSYNSYLVCGERTALIDTVEEGFGSALQEQLFGALGDRGPDYLVVNHMEPDHSGSIVSLRCRYPSMRIVGNAKTLAMIRGYYGIDDNLQEVAEGEELSLGGRTLRFYMTPMVHWPETMMTYCPEERTLFSGDAFGTFGALDGGVVDDQLALDRFRDEMIRYYACIVSKYGRPVQTALRKLAGVEIGTICSTHGPVWRQELGAVIELYDRMSRYEGERGAVVAYGSMYGNTARAAECIARELAACGVKPVAVHNLSVSDLSSVLRDVHKYNALVVGSPTYNGALFPEVASLLNALEERCFGSRIYAAFGSFTWAGAAVKHLCSFAERMKWEPVCDPFEFKQGFDASHSDACARIAEAVASHL